MGYAECVAFAGAAFGGAGRGGCAENYFERDYTVVECVGVIGRFFCGTKHPMPNRAGGEPPPIRSPGTFIAAAKTQGHIGREINPRPYAACYENFLTSLGCSLGLGGIE